MRFVAAFACAVVLVCFGVVPSHAEKRVALVIGNSAYPGAAALENPVNDAADVAAAQAFAGGFAEPPDGLDRVIARACAISPDNSAAKGEVLAFRSPRRHPSIVHGLTRWAGLAAAIAIASWLGFAMGSDTSLALSQSGTASDASFLPELLDPGTGFLRDLSEGLRG